VVTVVVSLASLSSLKLISLRSSTIDMTDYQHSAGSNTKISRHSVAVGSNVSPNSNMADPGKLLQYENLQRHKALSCSKTQDSKEWGSGG